MEDFMWLAGNRLAHMRLLLEGMAKLYENDLSPIYREAMEQGNYEDASILDTLESALEALRDDVIKLQIAHRATMK